MNSDKSQLKISLEDAEKAAWYAIAEIVADFKPGQKLQIDKLDVHNKVREYLSMPQKKELDIDPDPIDWLSKKQENVKRNDRSYDGPEL